MMRYLLCSVMLFSLLLGSESTVQAQSKPPYWASISSGQARMRTGPGRQFPASWLYQRPGLPIRVIETYQNWRKIEDPDGTQGWMQVNLLSSDRTGLIVGEVRPLRQDPNGAAKIIWRAEPGVVGRISECARGWCKIDMRGRMGFVETTHLWGVDLAEAQP